MMIPNVHGYSTQQGEVIGTYITPFGQSVSVEQSSLRLIVDKGVVGDSHFGDRLSDTREDVLKAIGVGKEVSMTNVRQLSIVSRESMEQVAKNMKFPLNYNYVDPTLVAANLEIQGIVVDNLPAGTLLCFASFKNGAVVWHKAVIAIWAQNAPCQLPHDNIVKFLSAKSNVPMGWKPASNFRQAAKDLRGVVGFVYTSGKIKHGDTCVAYIPE